MSLVYLPQIALRVVVSGHFVHKTDQYDFGWGR
jgi:hypothetical protein